MEGRLKPWHRRPVLLLGLIAVLFQYVDMLLSVAAFSLFLRRVGSSNLPAFYVLLNVASISFMLVILSRRKLSTFRLSMQMNLGLALTILLAIPFVATAPPLFFFLLYLIVRLHDVLCFTYFLTYVQTVFPVREAKREVARILGASSAACVLAGLSVKPLVAFLSMEALFTVAAGATVAVIALQILAGRRWPPPEGASPETRGEELGEAHPLRQAFAVLRQSSLAANVVKVFFLITCLRYLVEFQYSRSISDLFPSEADLASFVGAFKAGVSLLVTLAQLTLTHRLLARWRTGGTMALVPLLQLFFCALVLMNPWFLPIILLQGSSTLSYHVATRPAFNILLVPLEARTRDRVSLLSTMAGSAGSLFSGLLLLFWGKSLEARSFFLLVTLLYLLYRLVAVRLDGNYLESLERRITSNDAAAKLETLKALRDLGGGAHRDQLARLLTDPDPEIRLEALRHLDTLNAEEAEPLVRQVLEGERDPRIRATLARALPEVLGSRCHGLVLRWLEEDRDPRTRANLVEAIGALGQEEDAAILLPLLLDGNDRIRANAVTALLQVSKERGELKRALESLAELTRAPRAARRSAANAAMGRLGRHVFVPCLLAGLGDESPEVRRNALRSLGRIRAADALPRLRRMAEEETDDALRQEAGRLCRQVEEDKEDEWLRLARRLDGDERKRVAQFLKQTGGGARTKVLEGLLRFEGTPLPTALLDALRLCSDEALLEGASRGLAARPPSLAPMLQLLDERSTLDGESLDVLARLARFLPPSAGVEALECRLDLLCQVTARLADPRISAERLRRLESARRKLEEGLLFVTTLLNRSVEVDDEEGRRAVTEALAQTVGEDGHQASLAVDFLESRIDAPLFALLSPYLECASRPEARSALARSFDGPVSEEGRALLALHLPAALVDLLLPPEPSSDAHEGTPS